MLSLFLRADIHSPSHFSDSSFWYTLAVSRKFPPAATKVSRICKSRSQHMNDRAKTCLGSCKIWFYSNNFYFGVEFGSTTHGLTQNRDKTLRKFTYFESGLFATFAHVSFQGFAKSHGTKTERRDTHISARCELTVSSQGGLWRWRAGNQPGFYCFGLSCH